MIVDFVVVDCSVVGGSVVGGSVGPEKKVERFLVLSYLQSQFLRRWLD